MIRNIHIFAYAALGKGLSGSDRIFIEFAKRWSQNHKVVLYVWEEGFRMCLRQGLKKEVKFIVASMDPWRRFGFVINYLARIIVSIKLSFSLKIVNPKEAVIYSASEFWMDSLPGFILKKRFPKAVWVACWFQTAPSPFTGFTSGKRNEVYRLSAFYYWLMQLPIKPLISHNADLVLVNNEDEQGQFTDLKKSKRVQVVTGAVNLKEIKDWLGKNKKISKIYDGVFQGRFHPQKGVLELVDIWKKVIRKIPQAKLVMIGDGPLLDKVRMKINTENLGNNIKLMGYVFDGPKKYRVFLQSEIVVHPAFYDSGGMAAAEAMAFGLPCVGFDLPSYRSYYPKGMVKVGVGNLDKFANQVILLLRNKVYREKIAKEGLEMINTNWSWDKRAQQVLNRITAI